MYIEFWHSAIKLAKAAAFMKNNLGETSTNNNSIAINSPDKSMISEVNAINKSTRSCSAKQKVVPDDDVHVQSSEESASYVSSDDEWELPLRKKREMKRKPDEIILNLPARKIPSVLAATSTTTRTSDRNELKLVSTLFKAGGADINDANLSVSTIHRQRKRKVKIDAKEIRDTFTYFKESSNNSFLVLHFDGKIIQLMDGITEDRLAVALSSPCNLSGQFIASPAIPDGTGDTMAECVYKVIKNLDLLDGVHALVFDTTASTTGRLKGSSTIFGDILERPVLWLACRHQIPELFIKHANTAIRGEFVGPDDSLFKEFKNLFGFIDLNKRFLWVWPNSIRDRRSRRTVKVLLWADDHRQNATWPREDYMELLELVVTYLGGAVNRLHGGQVNVIPVQIRKPGAVHRARFMASFLYLLKICLYRDQFVTDQQNIVDAMILAEYIVLIHAPYFLKSPLAISAPRHDRELWVDLHEYRQCFRAAMRQSSMIEAAKDSVKNHLRYLTEELVVFGLFDEELDSVERKAMAT